MPPRRKPKTFDEWIEHYQAEGKSAGANVQYTTGDMLSAFHMGEDVAERRLGADLASMQEGIDAIAAERDELHETVTSHMLFIRAVHEASEDVTLKVIARMLIGEEAETEEPDDTMESGE